MRIRAGRFVCSVLTLEGYCEKVCSWTTDREVSRVGLRAGRFVEAKPRAGRFVEASYILGPRSSNSLVILMCVVYGALCETLRMNFVVAFLSYGSKWYPLSCGSGYWVNRWHSLSCGSKWLYLSCVLGWRMDTSNP